MYELTIPDIEITQKEQQIVLVNYDRMNLMLDMLAEKLQTITVTPENIQDSKKLVAQVRKACKTLNERRIAFKKEYLKPLETMEAQVKEIDQKAKKYEEILRSQIRELEEQEREEKNDKIYKIFTKRLRAYGSENLYPYNSFFKREYLNKSYSLNKVEEAMVDWFEDRTNDIISLINYSETIPQDRETVLAKYLEFEEISRVINYFTEVNQKKEEVKEAVSKAPKRANRPQPKTTRLIRISEDDLERVKALLEASQIIFEIV